MVCHRVYGLDLLKQQVFQNPSVAQEEKEEPMAATDDKEVVEVVEEDKKPVELEAKEEGLPEESVKVEESKAYRIPRIDLTDMAQQYNIESTKF